MKPELLKQNHLDFLKDKYSELYNKKFPWANSTLIESLIKSQIDKVIAEINEEDYLRETRFESGANGTELL